MSMNVICITGHLGKDVEQKTLQDGQTPYWKFSVATTRKWRDKQSNEMKSETTWHNCALYGNYSKLAEYLRKGTCVSITGEQRHKSYVLTDDNNNPLQYNGKDLKSSYSWVAVRNVSLVSGKSQDNSQQQQSAQPAAQPAAQAAAQPQAQTSQPGPTDDLPF
jgi:single-strand DNA-binding protein